MHKIWKWVLLAGVFLDITLYASTDTYSDTMDIHNGDIIFQDSKSSQAKAIKLATHSKYSHMGILYRKGDKIYVYEASATVRMTALKRWIDRGVGKHFVIKRLKNDKILTAKNVRKIQRIGRRFKGHKYDALFGWDDRKIYCSELVWKIYKRGLGIEIGTLKKLKSFDLSHPIVKTKLRERYGKRIPLNEKVISPQDMFNSPYLFTTYKR
jgi:uncharacterized protein YycO